MDNHRCVRIHTEDNRALRFKTSCVHLDNWVGTHRIQRIPSNDKRSRRHTSTATVALVPADASCFSLDLSDIVFSVARGSGPGGQHRNKTETAVTATHTPTGTTATWQNGRSQYQNKQKALLILTERLAQLSLGKQAASIQRERKNQIASAERPVKQFTWNTQRDELVDHETGKKWKGISRLFKGKF